MTCPKCGGSMAELDRSGVRIDACRNCRGVFLDRGELDKVIERERDVLSHNDDEDFVREMTGGGKPSAETKYGFDPRTAERIFSDYSHHKKHKKKKRSFLEELLD